MARAAEEAGFDSIWIGDHLLYREPERGPWDAWTVLAALAAATERVRLGPLVACTAFHPPGILARMAAAVAEISGGRPRLRPRARREGGGGPRLRPPLPPPGAALGGGL